MNQVLKYQNSPQFVMQSGVRCFKEQSLYQWALPQPMLQLQPVVLLINESNQKAKF